MRAIVFLALAGTALAQNQAAVPNLSQRPTGSSLGTIRVGAADNNIWFGWRVGIPTADFKQLTFSEALARADTLGVTCVEASSTQKLAAEIPKNLDFHLQQGERAAVVRRLKELNQQICAYRVESIPSDEAAARPIFEFAKAINTPMIIAGSDGPSLDKLANEFNINVAVDARKDVRALFTALQTRGKHMGIAADVPVDLTLVRERLMAVSVADRAGTAAASDFYLAAFRAGIKPLFISVAGNAAALAAFEKGMWPAMAARVRQVIDSPAGKIRGPDRLDAAMKQQIDAATPRKPIVAPRKPRKLLVTDLQMYSGHSSIPHGNLLLELIGKYTGAYTSTFSNDLELLKYPRIREFDAVYLNNVCGMIHNDPEVREGILRFVREGGGIGGHHAVTFANNNWPEFAEMMGGWAGAHHTEKQVIKVDDPNSPLTKSFGTASFEHTDEFYQFPVSSPYSREKQHVLLSIDVEKSDRATAGRLCPECTRPDQDYGLAWIKAYGKGRTYFTPLGHTTIFYTNPMWTQHILAALQYILGDLDADATPSAKGAK